MECPPPGSAIADAARQIAKVDHGVNVDHRCDVAQCRFVVSSQRLKRDGRAARVAVCTESLHLHWCGTGVCKLAVQEAGRGPSDGPWVCPISRLEVTGQAEVYCPQRIRGSGGKPDKFVHSMTSTSRRRASNNRRMRTAETLKFVTMLLASNESHTLMQAAATRRERMVHSAVARAGPTFMAQMRAARGTSPRSNIAPVSKGMLVALASAIDNFLNRIRPRLAVCKGNASQVAAVVNFLAHGLRADSVTIFPKLPWVADRLPAAADLGKLPGFQCRPVSISARHIKAAVFGNTGRPVATLLFRWTPPVRQR